MALTVDLLVSRIGPKWSNSNCNGAIGNENLKALKVNRIPELESGSVDPPAKFLNSLFKGSFLNLGN